MILKTNELDWGDFIKKICKENGISFRQLSKRINMSDVGLAKTLSNKTIKLVTVIEISVALKYDLHQLINYLSFGSHKNVASILTFQQKEIDRLELEIQKNNKYIEALEGNNEKTKLLREYENKEEIATFKEFLEYLKRPKEDIIGLFIEYQEWKKDREKSK